MISVRQLKLALAKSDLEFLPEGKLLINTINAFSYNNARKDAAFEEALIKGDMLIPDGVSIVRACHWLKAKSRPWERVAGWDLFEYEMDKLTHEATYTPEDTSFDTVPLWKKCNPERKKPIVAFVGSSEMVLSKIREQAAIRYPLLEVKTFSPPFKKDFTLWDHLSMVDFINETDPDLLWIGMTAPKQEKWAYSQWDRLNIHCHCGTVGAVFEFFGGTKARAPKRWQNMGLEWLYRLLSEPRRMWRRYLIGNTEFLTLVFREWIGK